MRYVWSDGSLLDVEKSKGTSSMGFPNKVQVPADPIKGSHFGPKDTENL